MATITADPKVQHIIDELIRSYWMELETVQNYIAAANNLVGVRAEHIRKSLGDDVTAELGHAQALAARLHILGATVPGSMGFHAEQESLQPGDPTDVVSVIRGVIEAEQGAIDQYNKIIRACDGVDYVTQDLAIQHLADEEEHRREFLDFLAEYE